jgi:cytochrome c-type biogenesis protein CcmH/NrfG
MSAQDPALRTWTSTQAYALALGCLLAGTAAGYLFRPPAARAPLPAATAAAPVPASLDPHQMPTTEQMRHMAEKQAEPLLAELKQKPNDPGLLAEVAKIYYQTEDFSDAIAYYKKSLAIREDSNVRINLGGVYFHSNDADAAIAEFERVAKADPRNDKALFNLGMVKWQGKMDGKSAIAAWQQLLRQSPNHPRRAEVEQLIARARQHANITPPPER